MIDLSIVITTYNREAVLKKLLGSLENQSDNDFEVVVAIDGSTDNTEKMLQNLQTSYDLKWVNTHCKGYGLAVARNQGILAANGKAVVIVDDDSFPESDFVAAHKQSVAARTITGGPRNPDNNDQKMLWKMQQLARLPACSPMSINHIRQEWPNAYLIENNICLYKKDWIDIGLFSERLKMYGFIGQEFFARAEYLGFNYQYNPNAAVSHHGQLEGDNGVHRCKKTRQTRVSTSLLPSFMAAKQYDVQLSWARNMAKGKSDSSCSQPFFPVASLVLFPYRYARNIVSDIKRNFLK